MLVTEWGEEGYMEGAVGYDRVLRLYFCQYWSLDIINRIHHVHISHDQQAQLFSYHVSADRASTTPTISQIGNVMKFMIWGDTKNKEAKRISSGNPTRRDS